MVGGMFEKAKKVENDNFLLVEELGKLKHENFVLSHSKK